MPASDRNVEFMRETWGTTRLATDYHAFELREVLHDNKNKKVKTEETELFSDLSTWDYGLEPDVITG